jgi:hypothetical protein
MVLNIPRKKIHPSVHRTTAAAAPMDGVRTINNQNTGHPSKIVAQRLMAANQSAQQSILQRKNY